MKLLGLYLREFNRKDPGALRDSRRTRQTLLWIFWPLRWGASWRDRLTMAAYAALILIPLAGIILAWAWHGPSLNLITGR